ncbi:LLM class F420-dependent oxidoreductase [Saccharopolyspora sp. NPDC050642]|uniref:LLM class F420-dependent oxidoreductase n=1 Tax=Saccharopolyspora sp. NPDC050642 TaxID=3157099 RepID=UPI0033DA164D
MKIGISLSSATDFASAIAEIPSYEAAGLDVVWVGESYGFDAVSALGALSQVTHRVELGSSVLGLFNRTPATTAMSMAGLDALSGGRALCGLGASGPQVVEGWHGVPFDAPIGRTREVVEICRAAWRRERLQHSGRHYRLPLPADRGTGLGKPLKLINPPVRPRIPVFLAALGEKNLALTAEIADGWLSMYFWPERAHDVFGAGLDRGRARRDPGLPPLQIVANAPLAIGERTEGLIDRQRPKIAHYVGGMGARDRNFYNKLLAAYGFPAQAARIQDLYLAGRKDEAADVVPEELLRHISLIGTETEIRERLAAYRKAGVTHLTVIPLGESLEERCAQIKALRRLIDATESTA